MGGKENVKTHNQQMDPPAKAEGKKKGKATDKKKKVEKKVSKEETKEEVPEEEETIEQEMEKVKMSEKLLKALEDIREPTDDKAVRIQTDAKELGWHFKSLADGFKFEAKGTLNCDDVDHFANVECHLVKSTKGSLESEDMQNLYDAAKRDFEHVGSVCIGWITSDGTSHEAWGPTHLKRQDASSVTISGARKFHGGWIFPTTLEISVAHSKRADNVKVPDIIECLDKGEYANVVLQLVDYFKQKKRIRDELITLENKHLGRLRFLVSQFEMIDGLGAKFKDKAMDYIRGPHAGLAIEWYEKDPSAKTANAALQAKAKVILTHTYPNFVNAIKPSSQRDLFIAAYDRTLGR